MHEFDKPTIRAKLSTKESMNCFDRLQTARSVFILLCLLAASLFGPHDVFALENRDASAISFRKQIAPILLKQCQGCHGAEKSKGKYRLDSFDRMTKAGESKTAPIIAGKSDQSHLYRLITTVDEDDRMPKKADPLPAGQIALIKRWIDEGAKFDAADRATVLASLVDDQEHPAPPEIYPQPIAITALAFSPEGKELAASGYHEITLWNPADGKPTGRIKNLGERIYGLAYSPDGRVLAAADGTPGTFGELRLCEPATRSAGKVLERINDVMLVARFSPDGARLAAGGSDNAVRIYNLASGKRELLIEQHADWVSDLAFSPDGTRLATASRDKSARIFDAKTGTMLSAFLGHEDFVSGVAFSDDGKMVYSAGRDRRIRMWAAADAKKTDQVTKFNGEPFKLQTNNGLLFSSCADGIVRQYKQDNLELVRAYPKAGDWVYSIAIDSKNHRMAAGCYNGEVKIWDYEKGTLLTSFVAAPGLISKR
jgi:dipeptidyl aminopeptidase/acylaminoacyl peptidase